ncbi:MAG: AbrB/MazE/SpoVT family DNA-binding domain-containing protein [Clostridia bacterium]|nr:AbrB/MazE/SpoVT family DNA-binding domain-containing protein [Clostridia bacterium]
MKATGIVRKFDENGRFVLPMELRKKLRLNTQNDAVEIFVDEDMIILRKYEPSCIFCGDMEDLRDLKDKKICRKCANKINILFED